MKIDLTEEERFETIVALRMAVTDAMKHRRIADKATLKAQVRAALSAIRKLRGNK